MEQVHLALAVTGAVVLLLGLFSGTVRKLPFITRPIAALVVGAVLGPAVTGVVQPSRWTMSPESLLEELARITLGIALVSVAMRLPPGYVRRRWRSLLTVLLLVMPLMWVSTGLVLWLLGGLPIWLALLLGAILTPTDPVVAGTIVTGDVAEKNLPPRLRHLITAESGANDGLAHPLVFASILLIAPASHGTASEWIVEYVLKDVVATIAFGIALGYAVGWIMTHIEGDEISIKGAPFVAYAVALSLTVLGGAELMGMNGVLAVFVAGVAFNDSVKGSQRTTVDVVEQAVNQFFILPIFIFLGFAAPWHEWTRIGWRAPAVAIAVLLFRRIPVLALTGRLIPAVEGKRDRLFVGWFGPVGIAAVYYAAVAERHLQDPRIWPFASLVIITSIFAHSLTATPLTRRYGRMTEHDRTEE
ncbi:MAG: cation:proton antiporter [Thermoanaerobaculia bacterium]